ncbi:MAG: NAD(P)H-dependent oxidoreductase [Corynebacterium sp.]|nr:NAD(P)H-dependent oxidoreductase [Corynebacterium sp.]
MYILVINAHPAPTFPGSAANAMLNRVLEKLPAGSYELVNLYEADVPPLSGDMLSAFRNMSIGQPLTPSEEAVLVPMGALLEQFKRADRVIISYPMHNFLFPAKLKDYLDNIIIPGETFEGGVDDLRPVLPAGRKVLLLQSSGAVYTQHDKFSDLEYGVAFLRAMFLDLFGFAKLLVVRAEGTNKSDVGFDAAVNKAYAGIDATLPEFLA